MKRLFLSLVLSLLLCSSVFAVDTVKYVSPNGTGDGNSHGSPDTFYDAYHALQPTDGNHTIIFVGVGTYAIDVAYLSWNAVGDNLTLQADTGLTADDVVLDSGGGHRRLYFSRATCNLTATNITFQNVAVTSTGGFLSFMNGQHLVVTGCKFLNNSNIADSGTCAGSCIFVHHNITGNVTITSSSFVGNTCKNSSGSGQGGALYIKHPGNLTITDCIFTNNLAAECGGAMNVLDTAGTISLSGNTWTGNIAETDQGGAIKFANETVKNITVDGDVFISNETSLPNAGGAIKYSNGAAGTTKNCLFSQNRGSSGGAIDFGVDRDGGPSESILSNCLFDRNHGVNGGAWSGTTNHNVTSYNNTYYRNTCEENGQHIRKEGDGMTATLRNEIHLFNSSFDENNVNNLIHASLGTTLDIQYCNIEGGADAVTNEDTYTNNINADPRFYNASAGEFTLRGSSPCIDTGTDVSITYDYNGWRIPNGSAPDMGAYEHYRKTYGGMHQSVSKKTSGTILKVEESGLVNLDSTTGVMTIYLPPLELSRGVPFFLHKDNAGNNITIVANGDGETIGGAASKTLTNQYDTLILQGGTDQWYCQ